ITHPMETTESYRAARSAAQAGVPMPNILRLSDQQISELIALTKPLAPQCRDVFLQLFADEFRGRSTIDDGEFYRTARRLIADNHFLGAQGDFEVSERGRNRGRQRARRESAPVDSSRAQAEVVKGAGRFPTPPEV